MILPIIHLNGTSKGALLDQRCEVLAALRKAQEALAEMAPNGRDYYPEPGRFEKAVAQHTARAERLRELYRDLEAEAEQIADMEG
jgi:hypothetical protein